MTASHTITMRTAPHPASFYIAHRFYPKHGWGMLTDGPEELSEVLDRIGQWSQGSGPDVVPALETLRVWRFQDDVPPRDVTEDVLANFDAEVAE